VGTILVFFQAMHHLEKPFSRRRDISNGAGAVVHIVISVPTPTCRYLHQNHLSGTLPPEWRAMTQLTWMCALQREQN
jgi:hypothetical protein